LGSIRHSHSPPMISSCVINTIDVAVIAKSVTRRAGLALMPE
jgi:hypothetical protein